MDRVSARADRRAKFGWGMLRMAALLGVSLLRSDSLSTAGRWPAYAFVGAVGALVNCKVFAFRANVCLLAAAALLCVWQLSVDSVVIVYLTKTWLGDLLAGKLDAREWHVATAAFLPALAVVGAWQADTILAGYGRIFLVLTAIQFVCEYGDRKWESLKFFRHRFSFELVSALLLFAPSPRWALRPHERLVVHVDLWACLFYRIASFGAALPSVSGDRLLRLLAFRLVGLWRGYRIQAVTDPAVAAAVMRVSETKGRGVEHYLSTPAWAPLLSLESVDGALWQVRGDGWACFGRRVCR
jgi:hypothetical protein